MKNLITILTGVAICLLQVPEVFGNPSVGDGTGSSIAWMYSSPLNVVETITDLGGGSYKYEYSFTNVDTSGIWHFGVYTPFTSTHSSEFTGYTVNWDHCTFHPNGTLSTEYMGTNLDSSIVGISHVWTTPFVSSTYAIPVSASVSGFAFVASTYDASPKYYMYETIASGYALTNSTGEVAAVGMTAPIPAPGAILLGSIGVGLVGWLRRRRTL